MQTKEKVKTIPCLTGSFCQGHLICLAGRKITHERVYFDLGDRCRKTGTSPREDFCLQKYHLLSKENVQLNIEYRILIHDILSVLNFGEVVLGQVTGVWSEFLAEVFLEFCTADRL